MSIDDLRDFKHERIEEFLQFSFGHFLLSGSFWLGVERWLTVDPFWQDELFWICVVSFVAGLVIAYFGFRQMRRRSQRIDRIIESAPTLASGATAATTMQTSQHSIATKNDSIPQTFT